ncbi:uncharacterized protein STEHIDRAFT_171321 [Stereum hirsutum FP-91666 SS1]|uniref:uncharacterized protein n=1 Tax=Stereum hirsutum (strain FP-91666) TaxID=721885 RepID=UPI000444A163|nr:uncharacterized protein STEHIDRAFT_171321 [Stereum hirsutum FP-91666 SS1]EIM82383.1 hypothetical protein STEHIDRAFT_171321 [Stereum hirsutum FP-91666 SS1]
MPVTTRSQTGNLKLPGPPSNKADPPRNVHAATTSHGILDDNSELLNKPTKAANSSLVKRARGLSRKKQGRLSILPSLNIDILYEIFKHLDPADLLCLAGLSKSFRQVLMSHTTSWLWTFVWGNLDTTVPQFPNDIFVPAWTRLIFGESSCHRCGTKTNNKPDFTLRRRTCKPCLTECLYHSNNYHGVVHSYVVLCYSLDCLPAAQVKPSGSRAAAREWYCLDDIRGLRNEVGDLITTKMPTNERKKILRKVHDSRMEALKAREENARLWLEWYDDLQAQKIEAKECRKTARSEDIKRRCLALGYDEGDFMAIALHREVCQVDKPMSDRVTTRSQNGTPQSAKGNAGSAADTGVSSSEEEVVRRVKISKVKGKTRQTKGLSRKKQGRLSRLPTLNLDVLFEIFVHLKPADLLRLAWVSKSFRQILMTRDSAWLWKEVWNNIPGTPLCPEDMSVPAWTNLLFGGAYCHTCGSKPSKVSGYVINVPIDSATEGPPFSLLKLEDAVLIAPLLSYDLIKRLPMASINPRGRHGILRTEHWLKKDLLDLNAKYGFILKNAADEELNTQLKELKSSTTETSRTINEYAEKCRRWLSDLEGHRQAERAHREAARRVGIEKRCLALEYKMSDVDEVGEHREVRCEKPMSDKVWVRVFPILKPDLDQARDKRLMRERMQRKQLRIKAIMAQYETHCLGLPPLSLVFYPKRHDFLKFKSVTPLVDHDMEVTEEFKVRVSATVFDSQLEIEEWAASRKRKVLASIPAVVDTSRYSTFDMPRELDLAVSVFEEKKLSQFGTPASLFGREIFRALYPPIPNSDDPVFSSTGRKVVLSMLDELSFPPETTTTAQLNQLDPLFVCLNCHGGTSSTKAGKVARIARNWRTHLDHQIHVISVGGTAHAERQCRVLSDEEAQTARSQLDFRRESQLRRPWGCCHCTVHFTQSESSREDPLLSELWMTREAVVDHLRQSHNVASPVEDVDLYYHPYFRYCPQGAQIVMNA